VIERNVELRSLFYDAVADDPNNPYYLDLSLAFCAIRLSKLLIHQWRPHLEPDTFAIVSAADLEREVAWVREVAAGPLAGVFGPRSVTWTINREAAIFLGAGCALLLQLAHPWVAAAIEQHSDALADPIRRFHRTFQIVLTMVFGTLDQSVSAARRLHLRHAGIRGTLPVEAGAFPAGSPYCANAIPALCWVYATLAHTALAAHSLVLPPLTAEHREAYYAESQLFAALLGIPKNCLPRDWAAFSAHVESMAQSNFLTVTDSARVMAHRLLAGADTWLPIPASYRALTAALLPPRLRNGFALRYGEAEQRAAERLIARVRRVYPSLPSRVRYVGPYQEAKQRLSGRARPDLLTRMCNRFWIGYAALPTGQVESDDRTPTDAPPECG